MKFEKVHVQSLSFDPTNVRKHDQKNIEAIKASLRKFGQQKPIVVDKNNVVLAGNGTLEAAKAIGWSEIHVTRSTLTNAEALAYAIADNRTAELADWDKELLGSHLQGLREDGWDLDDLGFDIDDLDMFDGLEPEEYQGETDPDEVPEVEENIHNVKLGQIYQLGEHRLMCGDSTDKATVEKLMNGEKADMVFTDPPYGYSYVSNYQKNYKMLKNDDKILDFIPLMSDYMSEDSCAYVCGSHQTIFDWHKIFCETLNYKNMIVWKKNNWSMGDLKGSYAGQHELILFGHKGRIELLGGRSTDVWEFDRHPPKDHPTQKPIDLISFAISKTSCSNVLDLFLGSGSTLIACEKTNRKCYGMELDPHYCSVIIQRWQNFTGKKAQLIN